MLDRTLLAAFAILGSQMSNALGAAYSKSLFPVMGPEGIVALRLGFSAILLGFLTRAWRIRVSPAQFGNLAGYGLALGMMSSVAYQAYARIPVGVGMAIEVTGPLALVIYQSRRRSDFAWVGCTIIGLALLLFREAGMPSVDPVGIALAFCSALCWACYIVFGKRVSTLGGGSVVAVGMLFASFIAMPVGVASVGAKLLDPQWLALGLAVAILSSAFPFLLQMWALRQLPARVFGVVASAVPAVGATMSFLVLGETLATRQWLGIALVVFASAGCTLGASRAARGRAQVRQTLGAVARASASEKEPSHQKREKS
jgi:inner membrane transporter RhtA